jgi:DNA replication protein DnaC
MRTPEPPPLTDELETLLRRLRLPHIRRAAPEVIATARAQRWEPAEVLKALFTGELSGRERSALATRRKAAAFPTGKTFDAWEPKSSSIPAPTQSSLRTLEWVKRRENLVVCGPSGTGKTFFLEALGHEAVESGMKVAWFTLEDLGAIVRRHRVDDTMTKAVSRILQSELIVVDDIGLLPVSSDAAEGLYRLVDGRWPCRPTCTRRASTRSCPRPWPPPPSTGCCTTPTCARRGARASGSKRPRPERGWRH